MEVQCFLAMSRAYIPRMGTINPQRSHSRTTVLSLDMSHNGGHSSVNLSMCNRSTN